MLRDRNLIPLSHQHHNALALCVLTDKSLAADTSPSNLQRLGRRIIDRFEIELTNHFALEEELLFPALRDLGLDVMVAELMTEHDRLEALVSSVRRHPAPETLKEFTALLRSHVRREENELFEEA